MCKYPLLCAGHNVSRLGLSEATRKHNDGVNLETYKGPAVTANSIIPSRSAKKIFLETYWVQLHSPGLSIGTTPPIFGYTVELSSLTIRELNSYTPTHSSVCPPHDSMMLFVRSDSAGPKSASYFAYSLLAQQHECTVDYLPLSYHARRLEFVIARCLCLSSSTVELHSAIM